MSRSYYSESVECFIKDDCKKILGQLVTNHHHRDINELQIQAWDKQIEILKDSLVGRRDAHILFEFSIPRMGKRADNIIIIRDIVFVLEFKVGSENYDKSAIEQVLDYSLDLKNFHSGSHDLKIFPIVVATNAIRAENEIEILKEHIYKPLLVNKHNLKEYLELCCCHGSSKLIDFIEWENSIYKPTPTIIEAAQALYKGHSVEEISRSDSGAINLSLTSEKVNNIIEKSKANNKKSICFITGVPGAGKTLAGLNIANQRMNADKDEQAVFLSGNGPLVDVLREALTRDKVEQAKTKGIRLSKKEAKQETCAFIQNIHHFRDDNLSVEKAPIEKVVIFDEAQRAWDKKQASSFMKRKRGEEGFNFSEPQFLIDVMDRHEDWCTVICLIGGGQEINTGEAGLEEWVQSLKDNYSDWDVYYSDKIISDDDYLKNSLLSKWLQSNGNKEENLHLATSVRSFRSEKLSGFIKEMLSLNLAESKAIYSDYLKECYPIVITRDFDIAKKWLKEKSLGTERTGVLASSGAYRLRPYGISVKSKINPTVWFLNGKEDVRSSFYNEEIATEFDTQGLELDWICVCWDCDLVLDNKSWEYRKFKGTKWQNINQESARNYLLNAYRVLLTRARQGIIIFLPEGDELDKTRLPEYYDGVYQYLKDIGIHEIK